MGRQATVIVGVFAVAAVCILMDALFGVVGGVLALGVGWPAYLAWFYYSLDIEIRSRQKPGDDSPR